MDTGNNIQIIKWSKISFGNIVNCDSGNIQRGFLVFPLISTGSPFTTIVPVPVKLILTFPVVPERFVIAPRIVPYLQQDYESQY